MSLVILPPEVMTVIFSYLDVSSLKSVVLVCRQWRNIGENPNMWKALKLVETHPEDLEVLLNFRRLKMIQYFKIFDWLSNEHVKLLKYSNLKTLDISRCYLHEIGLEFPDPDPELLGEALKNIEVVNVNRAVLSDEQWLGIFKGLNGASRMKTLIINTTEEDDDEDIIADLSHISPDLFAKAITKLETVQVADTSLTSDQLTALVKHINKNTSKVKNLSIASNDVSEVDSRELALAFNKLEMLDLSGTNLEGLEEPSLFFKQMINSSNLKLLDLGFNSFANNNNRNLDPKLLSRALNKVKDLRMIGADISAVQAREFFKRMCVKTAIKELHFEDCKYDMSLVNPNFLASGLNKISKVKMSNSSLNSPQCLEFFSRMAQFTKLQYLDFSYLDLCVVPPDTFSDALNKVAKVIISDCCVSEEQSVVLFEAISISTNIQFLDLSLVSLNHIQPPLLAAGARNLETLRLVHSDLSREQVELILITVTTDDRLEVFEISRDDSKDISDELIEKSDLEEFRVTDNYDYDEDSSLQFYRD